MRLPDWRERLLETISAAHFQQLKFGSHDCALFAAKCVKAVTGIDYAEKFRGEYESAIGAAHIIKQHGGTLEALVSRVLEREPIPVINAQRGDVVLGTPPGFSNSFGPSTPLSCRWAAAMKRSTGHSLKERR